MKEIIIDFNTLYKNAKKKVELKLWSVDYAKGYLSFYLNNIADVADDEYNEYVKLIDDL